MRESVRCIVCLDTDQSALRRDGNGQMAAVLRASSMQMALDAYKLQEEPLTLPSTGGFFVPNMLVHQWTNMTADQAELQPFRVSMVCARVPKAPTAENAESTMVEAMVEAYEEQAKDQIFNVLRAAQLHDCSELVVDAGRTPRGSRSSSRR